MNLNNQRAFIIKILYFALILGLGFVAIKYVVPLLMPFLIGLMIAIVFRKLIDKIEKKFKIKRSFVSIFILIIFYGILVFLLGAAGIRLFEFIKDLFSKLPVLYTSTIEPALITTAKNLVEQFPTIEPYAKDFIANISNTLTGFVTTASTAVIGMITGIAGRLPSLLIKLIFTIVASFFFTIDYYRIADFIVRQFHGERKVMVMNIRNNVIGTLGKFIKAYASIISITFLELSIGFALIGIPNPFTYGLLVAIVDILPILGTGAVLIPWTVIGFILGNTKVGIGMLILYIFITVVRQTIEPKIIGQQIGLHPIVTLVLMYVGTQLMGILGLLLLPIIATILKKLNDEGTIQLFK